MWKKINVLLICGLTLLLLSCKENLPTNITDNSPQLDNATQTKSSEGAITFIPLPKASASLNKMGIISDSKMISARLGGKLQVDYMYYITMVRKVTVHLSLNIPAGALPYDQYLSMALDLETLSGSVFVNGIFGPHGTQFLKPALLDVDAVGLDLSSLPRDAKLQLYYLNTDTYTYELMSVKSTFFNIPSGVINCKDGQLNHFSRYAFGYVR